LADQLSTNSELRRDVEELSETLWTGKNLEDQFEFGNPDLALAESIAAVDASANKH